MILIDTNVLVYLTNSHSPHRPFAKAAFVKLLRANRPMLITQQRLHRLWRQCHRSGYILKFPHDMQTIADGDE